MVSNTDWAYSILWCIATIFSITKEVEITACNTSAGGVDHFCPWWTLTPVASWCILTQLWLRTECPPV